MPDDEGCRECANPRMKINLENQKEPDVRKDRDDFFGGMLIMFLMFIIVYMALRIIERVLK